MCRVYNNFKKPEEMGFYVMHFNIATKDANIEHSDLEDSVWILATYYREVRQVKNIILRNTLIFHASFFRHSSHHISCQYIFSKLFKQMSSLSNNIMCRIME